MQIVLVITAPHKAVAEIRGIYKLLININIEDIRRRPYLPSLSKIAARIIEPATGASTWALGNHKWTKYKGILTRKAKIIKNHQIGLIEEIETQKLLMKDNDKLNLKSIKIIINSGREAATV